MKENNFSELEKFVWNEWLIEWMNLINHNLNGFILYQKKNIERN